MVVAIKITPLAARTPYIPAVASLITLTLSISLGFKTDKSSITFPSTSISGLLFPLVDIPLIRIFNPLPGEPEPEVILTPETCPCKACSTLVGFSFFILSEPTTVTAPVTSFLV